MPPSSVNVYMEQAVVVDLNQTALTSGQFSTCAPIVFFNKDTGKAGIYHLGGISDPSSFTENQRAAIQKLMDEVKPTKVFALSGSGSGFDMGDDPKCHLGHLIPITQMVKQQYPEAQVQYNVEGHMSPDLDEEGREKLSPKTTSTQCRVPRGLDEDRPSVTQVGSITASMGPDGDMVFSTGMPTDVEISLNNSEDVAKFMAMNGEGTFIGNPEPFETVEWMRTSNHPVPEHSPSRQEVARMEPKVEKLQKEFQKQNGVKVPGMERAYDDLLKKGPSTGKRSVEKTEPKVTVTALDTEKEQREIASMKKDLQRMQTKPNFLDKVKAFFSHGFNAMPTATAKLDREIKAKEENLEKFMPSVSGERPGIKAPKKEVSHGKDLAIGEHGPKVGQVYSRQKVGAKVNKLKVN